MFCPKCDAEYLPGFTECADCHVPLVDELPEPFESAAHESTGKRPRPDIQLVSVLVSGDAAIVALAKSLLSSANIEYMTRGEDIQDLFGLGRMGFNPVTGGVEFLVASDEVGQARLVLADLDADDSDGGS